jgi:hypothetical protein
MTKVQPAIGFLVTASVVPLVAAIAVALLGTGRLNDIAVFWIASITAHTFIGIPVHLMLSTIQRQTLGSYAGLGFASGVLLWVLVQAVPDTDPPGSASALYRVSAAAFVAFLGALSGSLFWYLTIRGKSHAA